MLFAGRVQTRGAAGRGGRGMVGPGIVLGGGPGFPIIPPAVPVGAVIGHPLIGPAVDGGAGAGMAAADPGVVVDVVLAPAMIAAALPLPGVPPAAVIVPALAVNIHDITPLFDFSMHQHLYPLGDSPDKNVTYGVIQGCLVVPGTLLVQIQRDKNTVSESCVINAYLVTNMSDIDTAEVVQVYSAANPDPALLIDAVVNLLPGGGYYAANLNGAKAIAATHPPGVFSQLCTVLGSPIPVVPVTAKKAVALPPPSSAASSAAPNFSVAQSTKLRTMTLALCFFGFDQVKTSSFISMHDTPDAISMALMSRLSGSSCESLYIARDKAALLMLITGSFASDPALHGRDVQDIKLADSGGLSLAHFTNEGKGVTTVHKTLEALRNYKRVYIAIQGQPVSLISSNVIAMLDNIIERGSDTSNNKSAMYHLGPTFVIAKFVEVLFQVFTMVPNMRPAPTTDEELVEWMYTKFNFVMGDIINEFLLFKARSTAMAPLKPRPDKPVPPLGPPQKKPFIPSPPAAGGPSPMAIVPKAPCVDHLLFYVDKANPKCAASACTFSHSNLHLVTKVAAKQLVNTCKGTDPKLASFLAAIDASRLR